MNLTVTSQKWQDMKSIIFFFFFIENCWCFSFLGGFGNWEIICKFVTIPPKIKGSHFDWYIKEWAFRYGPGSVRVFMNTCCHVWCLICCVSCFYLQSDFIELVNKWMKKTQLHHAGYTSVIFVVCRLKSTSCNVVPSSTKSSTQNDLNLAL